MPENPAGLLAGKRILVVEDEYMVADEITRGLQAAGAEVVGPAASLADARRLVQAHAHRLDMAVLDINLGGEMVYPLVDLLALHGIPHVFATGYDRATIPGPYRDVPRLDKPLRRRDLYNLLLNVGRRGKPH